MTKTKIISSDGDDIGSNNIFGKMVKGGEIIRKATLREKKVCNLHACKQNRERVK